MTTGSRKTTPTSPLLDVIADHKRGKAIGIASLCTANRFALQAGMKQALQDRALVCIEATSNQVDQFGGYSGLTPERFAAMVHEIAAAAGLPAGRIVMGGDHLGPNAWRDKDARTAMALSRDLVRAYVQFFEPTTRSPAALNSPRGPSPSEPPNCARRPKRPMPSGRTGVPRLSTWSAPRYRGPGAPWRNCRSSRQQHPPTPRRHSWRHSGRLTDAAFTRRGSA